MDQIYTYSLVFFTIVLTLSEVAPVVSGEDTNNGTSSTALSSGRAVAEMVVSDGCKVNKTSGPVSGTDLWCYECKEIYIKKYDPYDSPCRHNTSTLQLRRCGPKDRFCKVERLDLHRTVLSLERTCVQECPYGCKFNGYGLTYMRCISCCNTYGCNNGNAATSFVHGRAGGMGWRCASVLVALWMMLRV